MLIQIKALLRENRVTKKLYHFLWHWKFNGWDQAIEVWKTWSIIKPVENDQKNVKRDKKKIEQKSEKKEVKKTAQYSEYLILHSIWRMFGATNELMVRMEFLEKSYWCWKNENPRIWLMYVCCLLEHEKKEKAIDVLRRYISYYDLKDIDRFLPAAKLSFELGFINDNIRKTKFVFEQLESNREKHCFETLVKDKTIAVVGNGDSEIGKGNGKEIDNHDIVIRFNNFPSLGYSEDYGSKTDIWVRCANISVQDRPGINHFKMVIWEPDYWHIEMQYNHLSILYRDLLKYPDKIINMYDKTWNGLFEASKILVPTTGCYILWELYKICGNFSKIDLYGFSFPYNKEGNSKHYYDNLCAMNIDHNMYAEGPFLRNLYYKNGGKTPYINPETELNYTNENFQEPDELTVSNTNKIKIYVCAYRKYDVSKGKTGGPGGVLAMQQEIFGKMYRGVDIEYLLEPSKINLPAEMLNDSKRLRAKVFCNLKANYYIETFPKIQGDLNNGKEMLFICHDVGTALGAYNIGCKYVLIYHQQGGILNEMKAIGQEPTEEEIKIVNDLEKIVFENAEEVYFPSLGARKMFVETSKTGSLSENIHYADSALYNTIPEIDIKIIGDLSQKIKLPNINKKETEVFLSIGDFNYDKGMDKVPDFLGKYVEISKRKVLWIAIGAGGDGEVFRTLSQEKHKWNFEAVLIGERVSHDIVLGLINYSDYYIMLHRRAIFDLAILEVMRAGKPILLSKAGGNLEFNKEDNIIFCEEDSYESTIKDIIQIDKQEWGSKNASVFGLYFSNNAFKKSYSRMLNKHLSNIGYVFNSPSHTNMVNLPKWKNKHKNDTAIICGTGRSLDQYVNTEKQGVYNIALNKALFHPSIKFDYLFMQDLPKNQEYTLQDYNEYNCIKFYGNIRNHRTKKIGFQLSPEEITKYNIVQYDLAESWFDYRFDSINIDISREGFLDAQSVLFSAIQFCLFAGFGKIILYGIEFSKTNYGNQKNVNSYSPKVVPNLIEFKKQIKQFYPKVQFIFGSTTNKTLEEEFVKIDSVNCNQVLTERMDI